MEKDSQEALQSEEMPNYMASPIDGLWFFIYPMEFFCYFKIILASRLLLHMRRMYVANIRLDFH